MSISDSDIWTWARAVAGERGLNVETSEPDASPLALQGPKAEDVVASLFGDWVRALRYFWFKHATLDGIPVMIARSGWSKQGGFELYLLDHTQGDRLWSIVKEAGQPHGIGPGYPNPSERTESGLLNWDVDTDPVTNPFEVRMGRFVDLDIPDDVIGIQALRQIAADGPTRHQLGVILDAQQSEEDQAFKAPISLNNKPVGQMTHKAWSYRLKRMIGYALVSIQARPGDNVTIGADTTGRLVDLPFDLPPL